MNKPSQEIIDLAKELDDLGIETEPKVGDQYYHGEPDLLFLVQSQKEVEWIKRYPAECVVIPDIEWCLRWIENNVGSWRLYPDSIPDIYVCDIHTKVTYAISDLKEREKTPHLAVLKAMLAAVKTEKAEDQNVVFYLDDKDILLKRTAVEIKEKK